MSKKIKKEVRKFFKTVVTVTVLSEDQPISFDGLDDLHRIIDNGDCVGTINNFKARRIPAKKMVKLLYDLGSEPAFFQIDEDGKDIS